MELEWSADLIGRGAIKTMEVTGCCVKKCKYEIHEKSIFWLVYINQY
jgi:hypothetical protein